MSGSTPSGLTLSDSIEPAEYFWTGFLSHLDFRRGGRDRIPAVSGVEGPGLSSEGWVGGVEGGGDGVGGGMMGGMGVGGEGGGG